MNTDLFVRKLMKHTHPRMYKSIDGYSRTVDVQIGLDSLNKFNHKTHDPHDLLCEQGAA